jgi:hypothetical protein
VGLRNRSTAGEIQGSVCRLPIPCRDKLTDTQEVGVDQIGAREVGAVEDDLEEIGTFESGADQDRIA